MVDPLQTDSVYWDMSYCPMTSFPLRWRMWSVSTTLRRELYSTSSLRWSSLRTGAPHGDRWSLTRTSWEPSRTSARRCRLVSGWSSLLSIVSERRPLGEFVEENNFFPKFFHSCNGLALVNWRFSNKIEKYECQKQKVHWTRQPLRQELREPRWAAQALQGVHDAGKDLSLSC